MLTLMPVASVSKRNVRMLALISSTRARTTLCSDWRDDVISKKTRHHGDDASPRVPAGRAPTGSRGSWAVLSAWPVLLILARGLCWARYWK